MINESVTKEVRTYNGVKTVFSKWYLENWKDSSKKIKLNHFLTAYTRTKSKCVRDLNIGHETIQLLEENRQQNI